jgi:hypothetical protein
MRSAAFLRTRVAAAKLPQSKLQLHYTLFLKATGTVPMVTNEKADVSTRAGAATFARQQHDHGGNANRLQTHSHSPKRVAPTSRVQQKIENIHRGQANLKTQSVNRNEPCIKPIVIGLI